MSMKPALAEQLRNKLEARTARVGVVGLGYVGLPLAVEFGLGGLTAVGIDLDPAKSRRHHARRVLHPGRADRTTSPRWCKQGSSARRQTSRSSRRWTRSTSACRRRCARPRTPTCPTSSPPSRRSPSISSPARSSILESTTYPGTTEELVQPLLEKRGFRAGVDFFLAFSPERVDPGNGTFTHSQRTEGRRRNDARRAPSSRQRCTDCGVDTVVPVSSPRVAEMVKLLENTFRAVNIGLVNELALMCDSLGIDVWEVIDAAKTKPFGFMPFYPGPGLGGHCIPIDPFYLSWKAKQTGFDPRFIELAGHINGAMPHLVVDKIALALNSQKKALNGSHVLVVGVAYKRNIDDIRESPSLDVMGVLARRARGCRMSTRSCRRCAPGAWPGGFELSSRDLTRAVAEGCRLCRDPDRSQGLRLFAAGDVGTARCRHSKRDQRHALARRSGWGPPAPTVRGQHASRRHVA